MKRTATRYSQLQRTLSGGGLRIVQQMKSLAEPTYQIEGINKVSKPTLDAQMWVAKNAFMAEYNAPSIQYNTKSRDITKTILDADKLNKAGKLEDAQKLYKLAA